ncbi:MAG: hypothetical protein CM15mP58_07770 [Burkholderiaceae bacterium]|nr:MAG: hypothetical protein CM15mP58_07770 [Burkholderiaceae bacterium]
MNDSIDIENPVHPRLVNKKATKFFGFDLVWAFGGIKKKFMKKYLKVWRKFFPKFGGAYV